MYTSKPKFFEEGSMATVKVWFYLILHFIKMSLIISNDDLYKKFYQTDYKVEFEREENSYMNKSYGELSLKTFKYNRTHFVTNTTAFLSIDMDYDLEMIVQAYKFLSNEYRIFPLHFEYNFCKALKYNFAGFKTCAEKCGNISCPMKKNIHYFVCHCLLDESRLPPFMPTGRFKLELEGRYKNNVVGTSQVLLKIYRPIVPGKSFG